jgi:anti-anti-sigma regulatory factor
MTTRITRIEGQAGGDAVLRVEGSLTLEEARLLEEACHDLRERGGRGVRVNLAGLSFLDHESATLLCRLKVRPGVELEGAHLFVQELIERAERDAGA